MTKQNFSSVASYGTLSPEETYRGRSSSIQPWASTPVPKPRGRAYTDEVFAYRKRHAERSADYIDVLSRVGGRADDDDDDDEEGEEQDVEDEEQLTPSAASKSPRRRGKLTTNRQAFFTMIKAIVGSGLLFLPRAFVDGGIVFSAVCECFIAVLTALCIMLVVNARGHTSLSFAEMGEMAGGTFGRLAVQGSLIAFQLGLVVAYFIFVADTLGKILREFTLCKVDLDPAILIYVHAFVQIPAACLRNIRSLAVLAEIADICIVLGILLVLYVCATKIAADGPAYVPAIRPYTVPLFIGTSVMSFEGVAIMIPIKESMQTPDDFKKVLIVATVVVCALYTSVGVLGVLAYGNTVEQNILLSVGGTYVAPTVSILYSIAIMCSLPLQAFPAYRVLELALGIPSGKHLPSAKWTKNFLRAFILLALAGVAVSTRTYLHYIVAVIGGVAGVPMGFILPAYIHHRVVGTHPIQDNLLMLFGVVMMFLVTGLAVKEWIVSVPPLPMPCVV